jgi:Uracil DNA glycosylase superfamily
MLFYQKILNFYKLLNFDESILPPKVKVMNPYFDSVSGEIKNTIQSFYKKFYNDNKKRKIIFGINPGRHGAGVTGIPFTDTKRLNSECSISFNEFTTHETSSVFIYDMINAYGGANKFYNNFYISAISPLGFVKLNENGKEVNLNYYDDSKFKKKIKPFVVECIEKQFGFGIETEKCFCLGNAANYNYLEEINSEYNFFKEIIPLSHPRWIMQYRLKKKRQFIDDYLAAFNKKKIIYSIK